LLCCYNDGSGNAGFLNEHPGGGGEHAIFWRTYKVEKTTCFVISARLVFNCKPHCDRHLRLHEAVQFWNSQGFTRQATQDLPTELLWEELCLVGFSPKQTMVHNYWPSNLRVRTIQFLEGANVGTQFWPMPTHEVPMPFPMKAFLVGGSWAPRSAPVLPSAWASRMWYMNGWSGWRSQWN
jgi:hypothetical protein